MKARQTNHVGEPEKDGRFLRTGGFTEVNFLAVEWIVPSPSFWRLHQFR